MPASLKNTARTAFHAAALRHPTMVMPPNSLNFYVAAILGNALTIGQVISPTSTPGLAQRGFGGASSVNFTVSVGGTFDATKAVSILVEGTDENHDPYSEVLTLAGTAAATQTIASKGLFSFINKITVLSITGTLAGTESFTVGIGDATATPAIKMPNPVLNARGGTGGEITGFWVVSTTTVVPTAAGNANAGRALVVNFAANGNPRPCWPIFGGVGAGAAGAVLDSRTIDNL